MDFWSHRKIQCQIMVETLKGLGSKSVELSQKTLLPLSLVLLIATLAGSLSAERASVKLEIKQLQEQRKEDSIRITEQAQLIAKYRAQVDEYRTSDFDQDHKIQALAIKLAVVESKVSP